MNDKDDIKAIIQERFNLKEHDGFHFEIDIIQSLYAVTLTAMKRHNTQNESHFFPYGKSKTILYKDTQNKFLEKIYMRTSGFFICDESTILFHDQPKKEQDNTDSFKKIITYPHREFPPIDLDTFITTQETQKEYQNEYNTLKNNKQINSIESTHLFSGDDTESNNTYIYQQTRKIEQDAINFILSRLNTETLRERYRQTFLNENGFTIGSDQNNLNNSFANLYYRVKGQLNAYLYAPDLKHNTSLLYNNTPFSFKRLRIGNIRHQNFNNIILPDIIKNYIDTMKEPLQNTLEINYNIYSWDNVDSVTGNIQDRNLANLIDHTIIKMIRNEQFDSCDDHMISTLKITITINNDRQHYKLATDYREVEIDPEDRENYEDDDY